MTQGKEQAYLTEHNNSNEYYRQTESKLGEFIHKWIYHFEYSSSLSF